MNRLLFTFLNGSWAARLANTDVAYTVAGEDPDAQLQVMRGMAEMMQEGRIGVYNDMFVNPPVEPIEDVLFKVSNTLRVDAAGGAIGGDFGAQGTATLFSDLDEAGDAFLAML